MCHFIKLIFYISETAQTEAGLKPVSIEVHTEQHAGEESHTHVQICKEPSTGACVEIQQVHSTQSASTTVDIHQITLDSEHENQVNNISKVLAINMVLEFAIAIDY